MSSTTNTTLRGHIINHIARIDDKHMSMLSQSLVQHTPARASHEETMLIVSPLDAPSAATLATIASILASSSATWVSRPVLMGILDIDLSFEGVSHWAAKHSAHLSSLVAALVIEHDNLMEDNQLEILPHAPWGPSANLDLASGARIIAEKHTPAHIVGQDLQSELLNAAIGSSRGLQAPLMAMLRSDSVSIRSSSIDVLGKTSEGMIHAISNLAAAFPHGTKTYLLLHSSRSLAGSELSAVLALLASSPALLALSLRPEQQMMNALLREIATLSVCLLLCALIYQVKAQHALLLAELIPRGRSHTSQQVACASFLSRAPYVACINLPAAIVLALTAAPLRLARV
jgi:hypothetical protein